MNLVSRFGLPAAGRPGRAAAPRAARRELPEPLWLEWLALAGLLGFAAWLLGTRGVFRLLLGADPTGITLVIMLVFLGATLWCGGRSHRLQRELRRLHEAEARGPALATPGQGWAAAYWCDLRRGGHDAGAPLDLLLERSHGPHGTAWWVNAIQLKLGLLGKVIGFSILALEIGHTPNFDPAQSQELLRSLTTGLGVALLSTMVGLVGNIVLGLQLTRLDRYADALVAEAQRVGLALGPAAAPAARADAAPQAARPGAASDAATPAA
ncbi:hypothetical protein [Piscinibacter sakaiensis]|uniref:MotA/TolQ/ExbB proton channel domain-containing protein n=1 Tax=Piscinibacter sakaiensis TaxID=1547922 RepID=A0A0K8NVM6_PISS1|nr:hypothetical protein [Piscinibacter sakaiensis]GAP34446.1 hypothetical protein ISF6_4621 [Piscinibacter sakaiensis]